MKNNILINGTLVLFLCAITQSAFAQTAPTMNQPDNGFFEGPSPEWSAAHSTDSRGTEVHRQYHRDGVKALNAWLQENRDERGTMAYYNAHRVVVQQRNLDHRHFHTNVAEYTDSMNTQNVPEPSTPPPATVTPEPNNPPAEYTYDGSRPSRRSIIADAEEQNAQRR